MDRITAGTFLLAVVLVLAAYSQVTEQQIKATPVGEPMAEMERVEQEPSGGTEMATKTMREMEMTGTTNGDVTEMTTSRDGEGKSAKPEDAIEMDTEAGDMIVASKPPVPAPDWTLAKLMDANSDTSFTVDQFRGKVILVETIAVWCFNNLRQQREIQALHDSPGKSSDLISIALDIDPNESEDILRVHAESNGFDRLCAIAPPDVAREIGQLYGDQFLNPPSTPILIIDQYGEAHRLPFGVKRAKELGEILEPFLN